jgi:hypothetical protein
MFTRGRGSGGVFGGGRGRAQVSSATADFDSDVEPAAETVTHPSRSQSSANPALTTKPLPALAMDGSFARITSAAAPSGRSFPAAAAAAASPAFVHPAVVGAFDEVDESVVRSRRTASAASFDEVPLKVIASRDPAPRRFDSPPKLGFDHASAVAPPSARELFHDSQGFGFKRATAPTQWQPPAARKSPSPRRRSPARAGPEVVEVIAVPSNPDYGVSPRLRTAERVRRSALEERKTVHVVAAVTARQAQLEAEIERLERQLKQRDAQVGSLEMDNRRLREQVRETELKYSTLMGQYKNCHTSLGTAMSQMHAQQRDIERLQGALVGESTDNDVLRDGFTALLRSAQGELKYLRDEVALRDRSQHYMTTI